ncbi:unnamed protein product [Prunus armeniaca]
MVVVAGGRRRESDGGKWSAVGVRRGQVVGGWSPTVVGGGGLWLESDGGQRQWKWPTMVGWLAVTVG